jgi:hypothetical protein
MQSNLEIEMTKPQRGGASVRELKAAALDAFVKQELAKKQAADSAKTARLRELRLARDAAEHANPAPKAKRSRRA